MGHCTSCSAPRWPESGHDDLADLLGEVATPAKAAALVVRHLPPNVVMESGEVPVLGD
jgi:hypothetical protein